MAWYRCSDVPPIVSGASFVFSYNDTLSTEPNIEIFGVTTVSIPFIETMGETSFTVVSADPTVLTATIDSTGDNPVLVLETLIVTHQAVSVSLSSANVSVSLSVAVELPKSYGVWWAGNASSDLTRTDGAENFENPVPYYSGMSGTPSSPFDAIYPWSEMTRTTITGVGEVVKIPRFWYQWVLGGTDNDEIRGVKIASIATEGFNVSPAHMDRGDGVGERPYIYVGRYHMTSDDKCTTGLNPGQNATRSQHRSIVHNLGSTVWQWDYATLVTIWMLYLVEYASWNSQAKLGGGCTPNSSSTNYFTVGRTDSMPYHTGTTASSISATVYGVCQYRYIEGLWDNVYDWVDGIYFVDDKTYIIKNPAQYSDSSGGTLALTGRPYATNQHIKYFKHSNVAGYDWVIYTGANTARDSGYIPDVSDNASGTRILYHGGDGNRKSDNGMFCICGDDSSSGKHTTVGSRLMILPSTF